jgi:hypothetical protein
LEEVGVHPCRKVIITHTNIAATTDHKMQDIFIYYIPERKKKINKKFYAVTFYTNILNISGVTCFNPLPLLYKSLLPGQEDCGFFQWAFKFSYYTRNRSPLQGKKNHNN